MTRSVKQLPETGMERAEIIEHLKHLADEGPDYRNMKTWSLVYYLGDKHTRFLQDAYGTWFSANGLNPSVFKGIKTMESDVVRMTADLLNGDSHVSGVMTSGGTESCLLPVLAYREMGNALRKVKHPEMILPESAHVAWEKAAKYFGVKAVHVPLDREFRVDVGAVRKRLSKNTIMILGSAPQYPHGVIDPILELGALAHSAGVPLHVDACVGGYLLPFLEKLGVSLPFWDFRVPGVTSISADTHKYGFSAKGASVILYRNIDLMAWQMFVHENWPGGIFASPALLGTRPGGAYAAAWAAMLSLGREGYLAVARDILETSRALKKGIQAIDGLEILGDPKASLFAFRSTRRRVNTFAVADQMEARGWIIDRLQRPDAIHAMVTPLHKTVIEQYLGDLAASVEHVRKHPYLANQGGAAMYGMVSSLPVRGMVKKNIFTIFKKMYGPEPEMPDFNKEDSFQEKPSRHWTERIGMAYLRFKNFFS